MPLIRAAPLRFNPNAGFAVPPAYWTRQSHDSNPIRASYPQTQQQAMKVPSLTSSLLAAAAFSSCITPTAAAPSMRGALEYWKVRGAMPHIHAGFCIQAILEGTRGACPTQDVKHAGFCIQAVARRLLYPSEVNISWVQAPAQILA